MKRNPQIAKPPFAPLQFFKTVPDAFDPVWATDTSACFDICACVPTGTVVKYFGADNAADKKISTENKISILPGERVLVPTGLIFDIPEDYSVRLHSRSGLSLKQGLVLGNGEGVIDSDYVDPTFVILANFSTQTLTISHGDRIAQGEMIPDHSYDLTETSDKPTQKTNRIGGLGSTGVK